MAVSAPVVWGCIGRIETPLVGGSLAFLGGLPPWVVVTPSRPPLNVTRLSITPSAAMYSPLALGVARDATAP